MPSVYETIMGNFNEHEVPIVIDLGFYVDLEYPEDSELRKRMSKDFPNYKLWEPWYPNGLLVFYEGAKDIPIVEVESNDLLQLSDDVYQRLMDIGQDHYPLKQYYEQLHSMLLYEQKRRQLPW